MGTIEWLIGGYMVFMSLVFLVAGIIGLMSARKA